LLFDTYSRSLNTGAFIETNSKIASNMPLSTGVLAIRVMRSRLREPGQVVQAETPQVIANFAIASA